MTGKQGVIVGVALVVILALGVLVYRQMSVVSRTPVPATVKNIVPQTISEKKTGQTSMGDQKKTTPDTPDAVVDEISKEADLDNSTLNDEELGETNSIQSEEDSVSDFGTVYEETNY